MELLHAQLSQGLFDEPMLVGRRKEAHLFHYNPNYDT
jgi:hypothetical protein